jgi:hypothetical protein
MPTTDSAPTLKPIQLAALVILMAEAREVSNKDFAAIANFTLTGKERTGLEDLGLIESHKQGQVLVFQLTDKGWLFCKQLHTTKVNVGRSVSARSIFALLDGLSRSLDRLRVSHGDFFKQTGEAVPAMASAEAHGDVESRIRSAHDKLAGAPGGWVGLADLRDHLSDLDRATVDGALRELARRDDVRIIPVANSKSLTPRDRAAALRIGDEDNHTMSIGFR